MNQSMDNKQYFYLLIMAVLSFISMYILMYSMVDVFNNVYPNYNQLYMAGLMSMPMVLIELIIMRAMYKNKKWNLLIIIGSVVGLVGCFLFIRQQTAIGDVQFLKSMIPHHSGAILMCNESSIQDPEIIELCKKIRLSQKEEIDQMKVILKRLEK
ncbi:MAG: DUF305 domain-containing protein [Ignavibacteria bacterium]|jgi:hypothetical protein|nr:DUF305 domain-containing protein [Ignavibacteria bacterium]